MPPTASVICAKPAKSMTAKWSMCTRGELLDGLDEQRRPAERVRRVDLVHAAPGDVDPGVAGDGDDARAAGRPRAMVATMITSLRVRAEDRVGRGVGAGGRLGRAGVRAHQQERLPSGVRRPGRRVDRREHRGVPADLRAEVLGDQHDAGRGQEHQHEQGDEAVEQRASPRRFRRAPRPGPDPGPRDRSRCRCSFPDHPCSRVATSVGGDLTPVLLGRRAAAVTRHVVSAVTVRPSVTARSRAVPGGSSPRTCRRPRECRGSARGRTDALPSDG